MSLTPAVSHAKPTPAPAAPLDLYCDFRSGYGSAPAKFVIPAGNKDVVDCPELVCDKGDFEISMNYNGQYQTVEVEVLNRKANHVTRSKYADVRTKSVMEVSSQDLKSGVFVHVECEVR